MFLDTKSLIIKIWVNTVAQINNYYLSKDTVKWKDKP